MGIDDDDDYGADESLLVAMAAAADATRPPAKQQIQQPKPQMMQRPDRPPATKKVVQPTPQVLPQRQSASAILVSPRQRGNPILASIRAMPWEYSDLPADYVLGQSTCALFLRRVPISTRLSRLLTGLSSLKYHRLHPEYIYTRIRNLQGKYTLRVLLTMVDIPNHEDSLRELSKTSVVNNVTIILCWSAAEAARYLELYKSYENASFAAIRGRQASSYADRLVDFVTVPRSLNKSDAVAMVANFGSLKNAVNADPEQLALLGGWGGVKVKRWTAAVDEPFRVNKSSKRGSGSAPRASGSKSAGESSGTPLAAVVKEPVPLSREDMSPPADEADGSRNDNNKNTASSGSAGAEEPVSGGIAAALARLREIG
ncbi:hypothetical protein CDD80_1059 [Ophiocordyceps camponoti-rufipedis]|uniref:ERCC1-like central domain-containing protein n=1 Tax=Ophiocordyceps camponoti-rufipedis TaxID=2004952 RepID=A0A2C5ZHP5_9HYPO|nr:hypothetical protein CDD80_1059 [Ophiocordyceps camponoti-rufipedis]